VLNVSTGKSSYAKMPHQDYLAGMSNITVELWIKTASSESDSSAFRVVLGKYNSSQRATGGEWYMGLNTNGESMCVQVVPPGVSGSQSDRDFNLPARFDDGLWHHLAFSYDQLRITAYFDGASVGTSTQTTGQMRTNAVDVNIGSFNNALAPATDANTFNGLVADVRLWNRVRTAQEISVYKGRRLNGDEPGLVGYWRLDEGTGSVLTDRTANTNHGVTVGSTWVLDSGLSLLRSGGTVIGLW
jgi:hypothetical protein